MSLLWPMSKERIETNLKMVHYINSDLYPGGHFVPDSEAKMSIWDVGYTYGYSVYDVARTFNGKPWQLTEHIKRFYKSLKACMFDIGISPEKFERLCEELCSRNEHLLRKEKGDDLLIWMEATPGEYGYEHGRPLPAPEGKGRPTVIIKNILIFPDIKFQAWLFKKGVHLVTPSTRQDPPFVRDPKIKTNNRLNQIFAIYEARLVDPACAPLMLDIYGNLAETHGSNIFLVYGGELMTPTTRNILEGISRANVIHLAKQLKIPVIERDLQPFHLYNAEEAFISGSNMCITPVSRYNNVPVGKEVPGPITKRLIEAWSKWVNYDLTGLSFLSAKEKTELEAL